MRFVRSHAKFHNRHRLAGQLRLIRMSSPSQFTQWLSCLTHIVGRYTHRANDAAVFDTISIHVVSLAFKRRVARSLRVTSDEVTSAAILL